MTRRGISYGREAKVQTAAESADGTMAAFEYSRARVVLADTD